MIRSLRPGEAVPNTAPRRYPNRAGYVRLRWKVGTAQYVEAYEHRVFDGRVTTAEHVHHRNHVRHDNRPENLAPASAADHLAEHGLERRRWDRDEAAQLYASGASPAEIGRLFGVSGANVYRGLRAAGVELRTADEATPNRMDIDCEVLSLHYEEGLRADAIGARLGVSGTPVRRILAKYGISFRPGRPSAPGAA